MSPRKRALRALLTFGWRLTALALRRPSEAVDHVRTQVTLRRSPASVGGVQPEPVADWRAVLHESVGAGWPCQERERFLSLWNDITIESATAVANFDADPSLAEALWCIVRHVRAVRVVETGVSRGVTSRAILEAFRSAGDGHLHSIDLPPLADPWRRLVGSAVPERLHPRWTYVRGTSRRHLARVCRELGGLDVFVHDSLHTPENLRFEIETIWPYLRPGGVVFVDDAAECAAPTVVREVTGLPLVTAMQEQKRALFGFVIKPETSS